MAKPKRIRAEKRHITRSGIVCEGEFPGKTEPCYVVLRSDVRALAEQIVSDADEIIHNPKHRLKCRRDTALYVLKRAGMTPGKGTQ